jgi:excisionase family DNA binding protein
MSTVENNTPLWEPLQTPEDAAAYLRIHPKTVQRLARQRRIPALKVGKGWRFRRSDLDSWAASRVQSPRQPGE